MICKRIRIIHALSLAWAMVCPASIVGAADMATKLYFTHFTSANSGLPYDVVNEITEDKQGFIWLGTSSGLSRFDGTNFRNYTKEDFGLNSAWVTSLCTDEESNLWVGTDRGLAFYDLSMDSFEPFVRQSDIATVITNKVNVICKGPDGVLWISVNNQGLFSYDPVSERFTNYFFENGKQTLPVNIRTLYVDSDNGLWISLYNHELYYVDAGHKLKTLTDGEAVSYDYFSNDDVIAIQTIPGESNTVYVASVAKGLCRLDAASGAVEVLIPSSLGFSPEDLFIDRQRRVWMATADGIYIYDITTDTSDRLIENKRDRFALSDSHAFAVYLDSSDGLWIGTNVGGVNYSSAVQHDFEKYYSIRGTSLDDCLVRGFADDGAGHIWITTEKQGLLLYDAQRRTLEQVVNPLLPTTMFAVCYDGGMLWLGTRNGLYRLDTRTGTVKVYETLSPSSQMLDRRVYTIFRTSSGSVLVGTTIGLLRYDRDVDTFDPVRGFEGIFVTGMDEDDEGTLWVSTYADGLMSYDMRERKVSGHYASESDNPSSLPTNKLFSVCTDSRGGVWVTSFNGGFCRLDKTREHFDIYDMAHSNMLHTNIYFKIMEDEQGVMWVGSDKGLLSLDPETGSIRKFSIYEGLLNDDFKNCGVRTADGDLYFGSRNGFIRFNPRRFIADTGTMTMTITGMTIHDRHVVPSTERGSVLGRNVNETSHIHLSPKQNSFGFEFAILGSSLPGQGTILCRLEGYDNDWRSVESDNTISYYNVPAGTYTLKVKGMSEDGMKEVTHADVQVVIAQRFYKSTPAILFYLLALSGLIFGLIAGMYRRALNREKRKHEEYKRRREEEEFQEKLSFFSGVVHEIKTPLTIIHAPLQNIMVSGNLDQSNRENIEVINNGAKYLDNLVRELLDFVRIEKDGYKLNLKRFDIAERIGFLRFNFAETAKDRNLNFSYTSDHDHIHIDADETAINKVLNNLLHNAVKYAESEIEVRAEVAGSQVIVSISNDGPLITPEQREEIFKPFVKYGNGVPETERSSFGIGLALARTLTTMHGGTLILDDDESRTRFILTLPVVESPANESASIPDEPAEDEARPLLLVVEDNERLSSYLKRNLDAAGYRVLAAPSAEVATELLKSYDIEIIVTDIALPGMNGIELCRSVTSNFDMSHIPVVVVSAISSTDTKIECMKAGASIYIEKPFSIDYLGACIERLIENRASLIKAYRDSSEATPDSDKFNLQDADKDFLQRLDELIMQNIKNVDFSNKQIEEALFLSRSTLIRKVRALLETTPNDYLRYKRLSVAARLLSQHKCRISEVCYAVGFQSPSYFAKCFKEQFGVLPTEYQKRR